MQVARLNRLAAFAAVLGAVECGGGGGGGTQPPGPPTDLVKSGGDAQSWDFNNPLPTGLSVTAVDAGGRARPQGGGTGGGASRGGGGEPTTPAPQTRGGAAACPF